MERRTFEDAFRDAFKGAEAGPSEKVWTNIELDLEKAKGRDISRKLVFYKLLAAASITFALGVMGWGYYSLSTNSSVVNHSLALEQFSGKDVNAALQSDLNKAVKETDGEVVSENHGVTNEQNKNISKGTAKSDASPKENISPNDKTSADTAAPGINSNKPSGLAAADVNISTTASQSVDSRGTVVNRVAENRRTQDNRLSAEDPGVKDGTVMEGEDRSGFYNAPARQLPALYAQKEVKLDLNTKTEADPVALMFARLQQREEELARREKEKEKDVLTDEKLWTSVGFAAGTFNPGNTSITPTPSNASLMASNNTAIDKQANASGVAYSLGVSVGAHLNPRWVLQGGLNFLTQTSNYTANNVLGSADLQNFKPASLNEWRSADAQAPEAAENNKIVSTAPYSVNNSIQFISVPMQAGYLIVNKKVGLQLNAGLSTDLFLQSTVNPEGNNLEKVTQGRGEDSPYRSVNFSGLLGTEISYRFSNRYRVALNPGFRYPFSSIYKSDLGVNSNPFTFDIGIRFRYIFK